MGERRSLLGFGHYLHFFYHLKFSIKYRFTGIEVKFILEDCVKSRVFGSFRFQSLIWARREKGLCTGRMGIWMSFLTFTDWDLHFQCALSSISNEFSEINQYLVEQLALDIKRGQLRIVFCLFNAWFYVEWEWKMFLESLEHLRQSWGAWIFKYWVTNFHNLSSIFAPVFFDCWDHLQRLNNCGENLRRVDQGLLGWVWFLNLINFLFSYQSKNFLLRE